MFSILLKDLLWTRYIFTLHDFFDEFPALSFDWVGQGHSVDFVFETKGTGDQKNSTQKNNKINTHKLNLPQVTAYGSEI